MRMKLLPAAAILCLLAAACGAEGDPAEPGLPGAVADSGAAAEVDASTEATPPDSGATELPTPQLSEPEIIVPSDRLPQDVAPQQANNNLDLARHDGRLFLAFRSAPNHFASAEAEIYVVSTEDEQSFRFEGWFNVGSDLREPRLLSAGGDLWLYFAVLGRNPLKFEPKETRRARYLGPGEWSTPKAFYLPATIVWRARTLRGRAHLIAYTGGEDVYDTSEEGAIEVHWLSSEDGVDFEPAVPNQPVVHTGGTSETDLVFTGGGGIVAVMRNERGDDEGFGSKVCRAEAGSLGAWRCEHDPRKYDSPLLLEQGGEVYLLARRNLNETGHFDLGLDDLPEEDRYLRYQLDYWQQPKRCSLWRVDAETLEVELVVDLPSRGDTCFPAAVKQGESSFVVYNYSSPLEGEDLPWVHGQQGPTWIYRVLLTLQPDLRRPPSNDYP